MAVTGAVMVLFLITHMLGNLKIFLGHGPFNDYAHALRTLGEPILPYRTLLTIAEIGLLVSVGLHLRHGIWSAFQTLGWANRTRYRALRATSTAVAAALVLGFLSTPLAITLGFVK